MKRFDRVRSPRWEKTSARPIGCPQSGARARTPTAAVTERRASRRAPRDPRGARGPLRPPRERAGVIDLEQAGRPVSVGVERPCAPGGYERHRPRGSRRPFGTTVRQRGTGRHGHARCGCRGRLGRLGGRRHVVAGGLVCCVHEDETSTSVVTDRIHLISRIGLRRNAQPAGEVSGREPGVGFQPTLGTSPSAGAVRRRPPWSEEQRSWPYPPSPP